MGQGSAASQESTAADRRDWSLPKRIAFRFAFLYLVLYSFPFPIGTLPWTSKLEGFVQSFWDRLVPWVAKYVLGIDREVPTVFNGSGDRTYDYILLACTAFLALFGTLIWSAASRRREYRTLHDWLRVYVRYVLAATMLGYGMVKVFKSQFPTPSAFRLIEPYGASSPMALLWTFMGYSTAYTMFAGLAESLGGILLFFRRTVSLGALLLLAVVGNVVMLNFSYDVPVKIYSAHLWLMAAFLLLPDARRLANIFVLNRPAEAVTLAPPGQLLAPRPRLVAKAVFAVFLLYSSIHDGYDGWRTYGDGARPDSLDGAYEVEQFTVNNVELPPVLNESRRWRTVGISTYGRLIVRLMDDSMVRFRLERDSTKSQVITIWPDTSAIRYALQYNWADSAHLVLRGPFQADSIHVRMRKMPSSDFLLLNRGFHWINEFPYNK